VIGEAAVIDEGCVIIDSVILPGAHIGARVRLERSLVMGNVGDDSSLIDCVIGADAQVLPHSQLVSAKVPNPEATA
jgi:ADP-glucose pyrophosphorylase